eukprot:TRINITY_DN5422_c0_g1_i1.p1 TRINITY_DN5422_c0_g1~~TRINITY_DN5422_c0_g1_i1.p1  ORF type:complete len:678 (+),score=247.98 TRINITY_DN5422_c0_g1_i1:178-2034(+)
MVKNRRQFKKYIKKFEEKDKQRKKRGTNNLFEVSSPPLPTNPTNLIPTSAIVVSSSLGDIKQISLGPGYFSNPPALSSEEATVDNVETEGVCQDLFNELMADLEILKQDQSFYKELFKEILKDLKLRKECILTESDGLVPTLAQIPPPVEPAESQTSHHSSTNHSESTLNSNPNPFTQPSVHPEVSSPPLEPSRDGDLGHDAGHSHDPGLNSNRSHAPTLNIVPPTPSKQTKDKKDDTLTFSIYHPQGKLIFIALPKFDKEEKYDKEDKEDKKEKENLNTTSSCCIFKVQNPQELTEWLGAINSAISIKVSDFPCMLPILTQLHSKKAPEKCEWLNVFLNRYFYDMQRSEPFKDSVKKFLQRKFDNIRRPDFIGPLSIVNLDIGEKFLSVKEIQMEEGSNNSKELIGEVLISYEGGANITITSELYIAWLTIPLVAYVKANTLAGRMRIYGPPDFGGRFSLAFTDLPQTNFESRIAMGQGGKFQVSSWIPKISEFLTFALRKILYKMAVVPNKITFSLPLPGTKLAIRPMRYTSRRSRARREREKALEQSILADQQELQTVVQTNKNSLKLNKLHKNHHKINRSKKHHITKNCNRNKNHHQSKHKHKTTTPPPGHRHM